ncbi:SRPBCC family protein [Inquilinus limosus]|uniref:SRPBCC family protein n=1 Tax=Inquilinus limosus TaxID=171674 RepID=UPI000554A6E9|nr:SRPBCC family protein [Inquilinus limosus]
MAGPDPLRVSITVDAPQDRAFDAFANRLGRWWPLPYTWALAAFDTAIVEPRVGGLWFERDRDGKETPWGEVRAYEPPSRLVLSFAISPERAPEPPERASELEIRFVPEQGRTRIELEHRDLARHGDGAARLRDGMASPQGWPLILADFARYLRG